MTDGALAGIRVIDLSRVLGGPYCTQMLGDHGADVIKVEPPQGDETRLWGPPALADGTAAYFLGVNRNKRGIVLDLTTEDGRAALLGLLEGADVVVENFKTGTMEKWGIGPAVLRARFPGLVHCRVSGFGADGPLGGFPGYDAAVQAMTGLMSINGTADGGPTRMGVPIVDMATGLNAAVGILLALHERARSGLGQFVEVTLYDTGLSLQHSHVSNYALSGKVPGRSGNAHPNVAPYDTFETATAPIFLAVGNDGQFRKLCGFLGLPALPDDPRFGSNVARGAHKDVLKVELERALAGMDGPGAADALIRLGVPCGPVLTVAEAVAHPHTAHRRMMVPFTEDGAGYSAGAPVTLDRTPATYRRKPPRFGEHTREVLGDPPAPGRTPKGGGQG